MSNYPDYRVVSDDDNRWYVIDGQCVIHDNPFHSRQSAINYRDEVALRIERLLDRAVSK